MSDRLKNTCKTPNEAVINDITRDLETSLNTNENTEGYVIQPGTSEEQCFSTETAKNHTELPKDAEFDADHNASDNEDDKESDTDSIDEEHLKDDEVALTDDQKAERLIMAEELKQAGNNSYKCGEYERSVEKYTEGLRLCPLQFDKVRAILYCNRSAARMKLKKYQKSIKDCTKALELDDKYVKAYLRRASSNELLEKYQDALSDYEKAIELDPSLEETRKAVVRLKPIVEAKNEEMKKEMLGKLKDLGNMILKPFGLSTENFNMEQDPETKGYKINFKQ